MDETLALPSEKAVKIALRTQQLIAHETGVSNVTDPLGGSYFIESLTDSMEAQANAIFDEIDSLGGVVNAIEIGYFQRLISEAAYRYQLEVDRKEKVVVGVNEFVDQDEKIEIPILTISPDVEKRQVERLAALKAGRSNAAVENCLKEIREAAESGINLMPVFVKAAHHYVTLGEMVQELREVFGIYEENAVF